MRQFKSIVSIDSLGVNARSLSRIDRKEEWEQLIAQAVLKCYEKGILTKTEVPSEQSEPADLHDRCISDASITSSPVRLKNSLDLYPTKSDTVEQLPFSHLFLDEKSEYDVPALKHKHQLHAHNIETHVDPLAKNLNSQEFSDWPIRVATHIPEFQNSYSHNMPNHVPEFQKSVSHGILNNLSSPNFGSQTMGDFKSMDNLHMGANISHAYPQMERNNSFDHSLMQHNPLRPMHSDEPVLSAAPTIQRSQDNFHLQKEATQKSNPLRAYSLSNPFCSIENAHTSQEPIQSQSPSISNETSTTPSQPYRDKAPHAKLDPDLFIDYGQEKKSDSSNTDMVDFFSSELETNSEFSGLNKVNNLNDLIFNNPTQQHRKRAKSERDPSEINLPEKHCNGIPYGSEIVKSHNRGVRKSSLDLLLESSAAVRDQESAQHEMNLKLKRFSEFKPESYLDSDDRNSVFYAMVDTRKNELFLIDPLTRKNYRPAINAIRNSEQVQQPLSPLEGFPLDQSPEHMKTLKHQFSNFTLN